jgi:hypothetical protein
VTLRWAHSETVYEMKTKPEKYLYRINPAAGSVIIAKEQRARFVGQIHHALNTSKTWGEFRLAMPRGEYSEIMRMRDGNGHPRPKSSDEFEPEGLPGYSDGDYPPWLAAEIGRVVPVEILQKFGTREQTFLNGSFWKIPEANCDAIIEALTQKGFILERAQDIPFA